MTQEYYAHSLEGKPPSEWQHLDLHLHVAELARGKDIGVRFSFFTFVKN